MGALVQAVIDACNEELDKVAESIYGEMKGVVSGHTRSGEALGSIHIEVTGERSRFIGGSSMHLYYLNEGNGGRMIYPKNKKALKFSDGSLHPRARPYPGIHFVEEIASHY